MRQETEFERVKRQVEMGLSRAGMHVWDNPDHPFGSCGEGCPILPAGEKGPGVAYVDGELLSWDHDPTDSDRILAVRAYIDKDQEHKQPGEVQ